MSAELVGAPAALGAMGLHWVNEALLDGELDSLNPEVVLTNPEDLKVTGVEYVVLTDEAPTLFGQTFEPGPPDIPGSFALHMWFIDNANGQFADFNPAISCPVPTLLPETGGGPSVLPIVLGALGALLLLGSFGAFRLRGRAAA